MKFSLWRDWSLNWMFSALLTLLMFSLEGVGTSNCSVSQRSKLLSSGVQCNTRSVMLDLRQLILSSNVSLGVPMEEVVQVVPDNIPVERCLGGCHLPAHSCHPIQVRQRQVEVMLVLARWPRGSSRWSVTPSRWRTTSPVAAAVRSNQSTAPSATSTRRPPAGASVVTRRNGRPASSQDAPGTKTPAPAPAQGTPGHPAPQATSSTTPPPAPVFSYQLSPPNWGRSASNICSGTEACAFPCRSRTVAP